MSINNERPSVLPWPELSKTELVEFYRQIKENKVISINWTNPGRIDPKVYDEFKSKKSPSQSNENNDQTSKVESPPKQDKKDTNETIDNPLTTESSNNKFDLFDEFNTDAEKSSNEIFNLRLVHNKTSRNADKKLASMDKILDDMRKKYEYEHKQTSSNEMQFMVNENFTDDLNNSDKTDALIEMTEEIRPAMSEKPIENISESTEGNNSEKPKILEHEIKPFTYPTINDELKSKKSPSQSNADNEQIVKVYSPPKQHKKDTNENIDNPLAMESSNSKFDFVDEFNKTDEAKSSNEIFDLNLAHNKTSSNEFMVNENFIEDLNNSSKTDTLNEMTEEIRPAVSDKPIQIMSESTEDNNSEKPKNLEDETNPLATENTTSEDKPVEQVEKVEEENKPFDQIEQNRILTNEEIKNIENLVNEAAENSKTEMVESKESNDQVNLKGDDQVTLKETDEPVKNNLDEHTETQNTQLVENKHIETITESSDDDKIQKIDNIEEIKNANADKVEEETPNVEKIVEETKNDQIEEKNSLINSNDEMTKIENSENLAENIEMQQDQSMNQETDNELKDVDDKKVNLDEAETGKTDQIETEKTSLVSDKPINELLCELDKDKTEMPSVLESDTKSAATESTTSEDKLIEQVEKVQDNSETVSVVEIEKTTLPVESNDIEMEQEQQEPEPELKPEPEQVENEKMDESGGQCNI